MANYLLINEGFASKITDDILNKDILTISHYAYPIVFGLVRNIKNFWEINSTSICSRRSMKKSLKTINKKGNSLILIGKSMGSVEINDLLINKYKKYFSKFDKIAYVCVDGHGKLFKNIFGRGYGEKKPFIKKQWKNIKIWNYFQINSYPKGANYINADHNEMIEMVDGIKTSHWSIIRSIEVMDGIRQASLYID